MKTLLKGGTVVSGSGLHRADVLLEGKKIVSVGEGLSCADGQTVDVTGMLLFPGFIDAHTHFDLDVCNTTTADDFVSGTRSAICGGTTTVVDFACPNKGESLAYGLDLWHKKADGRCLCDYGFHMTIDDWNDQIRAELPEMFRAGVSSFKMYLTYPAMMIGDGEIYSVLKALKPYGGIAGVHCENSGVIDAMIAEAKVAGKTEPASHPATRPDAAEAEAISRLLRLAEMADTSVVVVHLSSKAGLEEIRAARKRGRIVYVETCPQYLLLEDSRYAQEYAEAAKFVCAPPLRKQADAEALWEALANGEIQTVSTDHCSFTLDQKDAGRGDFTKIPGGLPGVETRGILLYSEGVAKGRITPETMCRVLCENPAKLYGMGDRKGFIAEGYDGDIVVLDPEAVQTLTAKALHSKAGYTPFEGMAVKGAIRQVYLRGQLAAEQGEPTGVTGQFIPRGINSL